MQSFRNPVTNVLTAWGYVNSNGDDLARAEADDFGLEPGEWQLVDGAWIAYEPTPVIPTSVTPLQASRALLQTGLLDSVETAIAAADRETQLAWQKATAIERNSPFVATMATALSLSDADLDQLFILAEGFAQ